MTRLLATLQADARLQFRNGFYVASALVAAASIGFLSWTDRTIADLLLPAFLFEGILINTFYFVAGLLLLERAEGTLLAQAVTPLRDREYLISKTLTLTALSIAECLVISAVIRGVHLDLIPQALGIVLASIVFTWCGVGLAARYESINQFLFPSVALTSLLSLPLLGYFGIGASHWYVAHPLHGALQLLEPRSSAGSLLHWTLYSVLWAPLAYVWGARALRQARAA